MPVPWLRDLEDALWALLPAHEEPFLWDGEVYVCERALEEHDGEVFFVEHWRDPTTRGLVKAWRERLITGAWVGLPPALQASTVQQLVLGIAGLRPRTRPRPRADTFNPGRFATHMAPRDR